MKKDALEGLFILIITIIVFGGLMICNKLDLFVVVRPDYCVFEGDLSDYTYLDTINYFNVVATKYNPVLEQCDSDPLITADGSYIDTLSLMKGDLKWVAISRDLRKYFNYGDTIVVENSPEIDGEYVVHDTMNPRWKSRIDLLSPRGDSLGKWDNVYIYKK